MPLEEPNLISVDHVTPAVPALPDSCCARCAFVLVPPPETGMPPICRRHPPTPVIAKFFWNEEQTQTIGNSQVAVFPFVAPQGWCGEFKRASKEVQ